MSNVPGELKYTRDHEWVALLEDGTVRVGITDHAQAALGDLVFVEVPEAGSALAAGDACAVVESVKAASDVYCPVSGEILEVNETLADSPETINQDPYGDGWIMTIQPDDADELEELMDADAYQELLDRESD
ncbi:MAG TPA: glycine cleavage system protein GcvH [Gammaproteobacteria bacterium]|nr:glycine cleavage system protein GcvH [Gammaproteobacteria bacterium]